MDDAHRLARDPHGRCNFRRVIVHEHDIGRLDGGVGAHRAHRDTDIGAREHGCVVDAIADERELSRLTLLLREQFLDFFHLVLRQELAMDFVEGKLARNIRRDDVVVARQHDGFLHAICMERGDGSSRMFLDDVGDDDMADVFAIHRNMDDRAVLLAWMPFRADGLHELSVADIDFMAVDTGADALAREFFDVFHRAAVGFVTVGRAQRRRNRMRGKTLDMRGHVQQLVRRDGLGMDVRDLERALRQRARLVKDNGIDARKRFEIIRALDKHTRTARAADAGEERERDADDERARTADDEERQRAIDPGAECRLHAKDSHAHERWQDGKRNREADDDRRVDAGEARDEVLSFRLARARVLDEGEDFRGCRFAKRFRRADGQQARLVDTAREHAVALVDAARQALSCESHGVEHRRALCHDAVQRDFLARLDDDGRADGDVVRINAGKLSILLNIRVVWADVHEIRDVVAALSDRIRLKPFADLIEQHDGDGLGVVAVLIDGKRERAERRDGHEQAFVERLLVHDAAHSLVKDVIADDEVRYEERDEARRSRERQLRRDHGQHGRDEDADEVSLLFLCHSGDSLRRNV